MVCIHDFRSFSSAKIGYVCKTNAAKLEIMEFLTQVLETSVAERRRIYGLHHIQDQWPQYAVFGGLLVINTLYYLDGRSSQLALIANAVIVLLLVFNAVRAFGSKPVQERFSGYQFGLQDGQLVAVKAIGTRQVATPLRLLRAFEKPRYFILYYAKNKYFYVPKSLFNDERELEAFQNAIAEQLK